MENDAVPRDKNVVLPVEQDAPPTQTVPCIGDRESNEIVLDVGNQVFADTKNNGPQRSFHDNFSGQIQYRQKRQLRTKRGFQYYQLVTNNTWKKKKIKKKK